MVTSIRRVQTPLSQSLARHPLLAFAVLAYAFSWWTWPLYALELSPAPIVGFGPFLAATAVLGLTGGRSAVKRLLRQMVRWRVGLRWYALALGLPIALSTLALYLNISLGAPTPGAEQLSQWPSILPAFLALLLVPGIGGTWEEPGWRGYLLPNLGERHSNLAATLLVGVVWAGWHLPLFLTGIVQWADLVFIFGTTVIFNWVYYRADRSVLIVMIFHAMNNAAGQFFSPLFSGAYETQLALLRGGIWMLIAMFLLLARWHFWTESSASEALDLPQVLASER